MKNRKWAEMKFNQKYLLRDMLYIKIKCMQRMAIQTICDIYKFAWLPW